MRQTVRFLFFASTGLSKNLDKMPFTFDSELYFHLFSNGVSYFFRDNSLMVIHGDHAIFSSTSGDLMTLLSKTLCIIISNQSIGLVVLDEKLKILQSSRTW